MKINSIRHKYDSGFLLNVSDLNFEKNKIYGLVGENGAGKTTLMEILSGFMEANIESDYEKEEKNILYIPSEMKLYDFMTLNEFIKLFIKYSKVDLSVDEIKNLLDMEDMGDKLIEEMSLGLKKRITLIPLLVGNNDLVILDEPFNGIDYKYINKLKNKILEREAIYLISSHMMDTLDNMCDEIIEIEEGKNTVYSMGA